MSGDDFSMEEIKHFLQQLSVCAVMPIVECAMLSWAALFAN